MSTIAILSPVSSSSKSSNLKVALGILAAVL